MLITSDELLERELDAAVFVDDDPLCELFRPLEDCGQEAAEAVAPLVGAYYDPNKGRITLPVDGDRLTPYDQAILAHELTHSLTDGHFRSSTQRAELWENGDTDAAAALKALVEGDANYVMALYIDQYPESNALDDTAVDSNEEAEADPLPALEWARLWFTYGQGWSYVRTLVEGGGLAAVNDAYADPVRSTEQVLSGPRLAAGPPVVVDAELPDPPVGYELYETGEWGHAIGTCSSGTIQKRSKASPDGVAPPMRCTGSVSASGCSTSATSLLVMSVKSGPCWWTCSNHGVDRESHEIVRVEPEFGFRVPPAEDLERAW